MKDRGDNRYDRQNYQKAMLIRETSNWVAPIVIDSGATCHMLKNKVLFSNMKKSYPRTVTIGDGSRLYSNIHGTATIRCPVGEGMDRNLALGDALYVPSLDTNLISCSALDKDGYSVLFQDEECSIMRNGQLMCTAAIDNGLYVLKSALAEASAHVAKAPIASEELWHRSFGHVYLRTLKRMKSDGKVSGISFSERPQNDVSAFSARKGSRFD